MPLLCYKISSKERASHSKAKQAQILLLLLHLFISIFPPQASRQLESFLQTFLEARWLSEVYAFNLQMQIYYTVRMMRLATQKLVHIIINTS